MSGDLDLLAGRSLIRNIVGNATVPNTNNGATLMIPAAAFATVGSKFLVFPSIPNVAQVASNFTSSNAPETLMAGGGPPAFDWCPRVNWGCTNQTNPGGTPGFLGIMEYRTGNGFGGTFRVLRNVFNAAVTRTAGSTTTGPGNPGFIKHNHQPTTDPQPWGGGQPFDPGAGAPNFTGAVLFTQNNGPVPLGKITRQPNLTTMATPTPGGIGQFGSIVNQGTFTGGGLTQPTAFETGFPATTGEIFNQDSIGFGLATFTDFGSDMRNANGHGTITLVASGLSNNLAAEVFPLRLIVRMVFAPVVPTMSAPGIAALGALMLLGAGYMMRRRL
jgi:hypothetical protein